MSEKQTTASWGSRLGFILASAGSAVGLGAIWKFPYMAGTNGGSVFMLPYSWPQIRENITRNTSLSEGAVKFLRLMMIGFSPVLVLVVLVSGLV